MKKVGVLTFQFAHNYGALLQAYALKTAIEKMGAEVRIINYYPKDLADTYSLNPLVFMRRAEFGNIKSIPWRINQALLFRNFQKEVLEIGKKIKNIKNSQFNKFDVIVVGSDQVWNQDIVPDLEKYLLKDVSVGIKVAYAASIGKKRINKSVEPVFKQLLSDFSLISVRERNTVDLFKALGIKTYHALDPVFLISRNEWKEFYSKKSNINIYGAYILYIDLMNDFNLKKLLKNVMKDKKMQAYAIHPTAWKFHLQGVKQLYNVGPYEYLYLIDHASYIVTNSFHGVAFSYIFKKKLFYYLNNKLSNRIEDFFTLMELNPKDVFFDFEKAPDIQLNEIGDMRIVLSCLQNLLY